MILKNGSRFELSIAIGKSRKETRWKNIVITWQELVNRLSETVKTYETYNDYISMKKDEQAQIKDVGGFVGGELRNGTRKNEFVKNRSIVTLDIDYGTPDLWNDIESLTTYALVAYGTHKYTEKTPRIRLVIPLNRKVSPEEYEAIARKLASEIGMDYFDDTTYEPARLMFWPSTPKDINYFYRVLDNPILDADSVLAKYPDWKDTSYWPESSRSEKVRAKTADKQGDPLEKEGLIGAFCRTYSIQEAIEKFIPNEYVEAGKGRYTYVKGSTYGGLVIYQDKFAYSNHSTDPTGGMLCNAFDLVRIHKFHDEDAEAKEGTPVNKLPSWNMMMDLVRTDKEVRVTIAKERQSEAAKEFAPQDEEITPEEELDTKWMENLTVGKNGIIETTRNNLILILKNDPRLNGLGKLNLFNGRYIVTSKLPWVRNSECWTDVDDAGLMWYVEEAYSIEGKQKILDAKNLVFNERAYHPVKEYLNSLKWDGKPRVESLFCDYLGADRNEYTYEITRKTLAAAVARIFNPGCKFDFMLTLVGPQGIGKSMLLARLGGEWFSDTLTDVKGKESYEALDGVWIMEMGELTALKRSERETIKQYISKQVDTYRKAYERNVTVNKRQCIFIGTTNDNEFLNDSTGGRRFWVIDTHIEQRVKKVWDDFTDEERDQVWAEAVQIYRKGESINGLSDETLKMAQDLQQSHSEDNDMLGLIEVYLNTPIPSNWDKLSIPERTQWINATDEFRDTSNKDDLKVRTRISAIEVWCECLQQNKALITKAKSREINECLSRISGWESTKGTKKFGPYGVQRGFIKKGNI